MMTTRPRPTHATHRVRKSMVQLATWIAMLIWPLPARCQVIVVPNAGADADAAFLAGLRQRQLFSLAERYCATEFALQEISGERKGRLAEQWIRTLAQHAANEEPGSRAPLWQQARRVAESVKLENPRYFLVQMQTALAELTRAELAREEMDVASPDARATALDAVRSAQRYLEQLNKLLDAEIPARRRKPPQDPAALNADALFSLQAQVQYHLASSLRLRARCYPAGADDRVAAAHAALEWCEKPLLQLDPKEAFVKKIQIEQAACHRLLGQTTQCEKLLRPLLTATDLDIQQSALAEAARLRLDQKNPDAALSLLRLTPLGKSPDLDLVRLDASLQRFQTAKSRSDEAQTSAIRDEAVQLTKLIRAKHGAYWGRRADQALLAAAGGGSGANGDLEIMSRQADELVQRNQLVKAIAAYDAAEQLARKSGDSEAAFQFGYKAALTAKRLKQPQMQADRLRRIAVSLPQVKDASGVHFHAIALLAQLAKQENELLGAYEESLAEHAKLWPSSERAGHVLQWQGQLLESRSEWQDAAAAYRLSVEKTAVGQDGALASTLDGFHRCIAQHIAGLPAEKRSPTARDACEWLMARILENGSAPRVWNDGRRAAALAASRLYLLHVKASQVRVESLLKAALRGTPPEDFAVQARPLLIVALAAQPSKAREAEQILEQLQGVSQQQLLETLEGLNQAMTTASATARASTAKLQLRMLEKLQTASLPEATQSRLAMIRADSLAAAGDSAAAENAYATLSRERPRSLDVQLRYAEFLSAQSSPSPALLEKAVSQWRRIATKARPKSELWYRSKYEVARQLLRQGKKREAADRLRHVQALYGFNAAPSWKARYAELLRSAAP